MIAFNMKKNSVDQQNIGQKIPLSLD